MYDEILYRTLFEQTSDGVLILDLEGVCLSVNVRAANMLGYHPDELSGMDYRSIVVDRERAQSESIFQHLLAGYDIAPFERTFRRKDGSEIFVEINLHLVRDHEDSPLYLQCVVQDITRSKLNEIELQKRIDQMAALRQVDTEISSTLRLDQVLFFALNAAVSLSGADAGFIVMVEDSDAGPQHIIHTYGPYDGYPIQENEVAHGVVGRVMNTQQAELIPDVTVDPHYFPDLGQTRAQMVFPLMLYDQLVGVINLETTRTDRFTPEIFDFLKLLVSRLAAAINSARLYQVTETQLEELQDLYAQVSKLERLKTDMIRIASHDLRNPVGLINGYLELLRIDADARLLDAEKEYIQAIARSVERMQQIIDDILSLERINQVASNQLNELADLNTLVTKAVTSHTPEALNKSLILDLNTIPAPVIVRGDPTQLYEALSNLIGNAIKYTPEGGAIEVSIEQPNGNTAVVAVRDTGYGVPESQQARLFEPFFRARSQETEDIAGVGLGLHLVKNIIERHHGRMIFESVYGQGSTFGFELPLAPQPQE